jgi:hypothetical protein
VFLFNSSILSYECIFQSKFCIVGSQVEPNIFVFLYFKSGVNKIEKTP